MKRLSLITVVACATFCLGFQGAIQAQKVFNLGFSGPGSFSGNAGDSVGGQYLAELNSSGDGPGAQGWSVSISGQSASIDAITTAGASMLTFFSGGFNKTQVTTAGVGACAGRNGAVSAIVLSLTEGNTLPEAGTESIAVLDVSMVIPAGGGSAELQFINGCQGSGQPVDNNITQDGNTVPPTLTNLSIQLREIVSCCGKPSNLGFSSEKVSSATPFDGLADAGDGLCAGIGQIVNDVGPGVVGTDNVYAAISSDGAGEGVQGWSFSIVVNGQLNITSVTTAGTPGIDNNFSGGFNKTQIVDPAAPENAGKNGVVSAIVLSLTENKVLPPTGTEAVLDIGVEAQAAQAEDAQSGMVQFVDGLKGSGQPVSNALTVDGNTVAACNAGTASVEVVFQLLVNTDKSFVRGNANNDGKVDIADPIWIINELFRGGPASTCQDAADANNDGMVDAADAVYLIAYEFQGGSPPAEPFPACGTDPESTDDGVSCDESHSDC